MSDERQRRLLQNYLTAQETFERAKRVFEEQKREFYANCEEYYNANGQQKTYAFDGLSMTRIQKVLITFDIPALERALPKEHRDDVIVKSYTISDFDGLVKYLKSIGADPRVFKTFLTVSKAVDEKALDQLEAVGKIDARTLENCYTVHKKDPYFTIRSKDRAQDGEKRC